MHALVLALAINWNADLAHLERELPKLHPNPFHKTTAAAFHDELTSLKARAPKLEPHEVVVDLARIVATIGDGHTRVTLPLDPSSGFFLGHAKTAVANVPVFHTTNERYVILSDGLYTTDGKRVTHVGDKTADEAIAAVMPLAHGDNEWQKKEIAAMYLAIPEVLAARGIRWDGPVQTNGKPFTPPQPWRFEHLPEKKAVFFTYNEVTNTPEESLAAFAERMFRFIDEHPVEKLVIDLRNNYGGNGSLNQSLLHGLIRAKKLQAPGSLYVLTGRRTFSAALFFAVDLERHTNAIFIGEPTGGAPNSYGDSRRLVLPESGITVRISTLYWQKTDPRDQRDTIPPHVYVEPRFDRDRELSTALDAFTAPGDVKGTWKGTISIEHERAEITIIDGAITTPEWNQYPLQQLRVGANLLTGVISAGGRQFLVVAERLSS